jgi:hypothetical protein
VQIAHIAHCLNSRGLLSGVFNTTTSPYGGKKQERCYHRGVLIPPTPSISTLPTSWRIIHLGPRLGNPAANTARIGLETFEYSLNNYYERDD